MRHSLSNLISFIQDMYPEDTPIQLHAPVFTGREKDYLVDCIETTYVSYVGKYVTKFENSIASFVGAKHAIAVVNGTVALQIMLKLAGVDAGDEVITQALTFVATPNAINHAGGIPVFVDVDIESLGMSPEKLDAWLTENTRVDHNSGKIVNIKTGNKVSAIVPMHTFGHPCRIKEIGGVAEKYNLPLIEDSAEALGSFLDNKHVGTFGLAGIFSFNGNKTITTGGGGMIVTDDDELAVRTRHITTTAKKPHPWEYVHDEIGYNYRMPNVNAAIGFAQMERLVDILEYKRGLAHRYSEFCAQNGIGFVWEPERARANFWLNAVILEDREERDEFLRISHEEGIKTRPIWKLMNKQMMYKKCVCGNLANSDWFEDRIVNVPSGVRSDFL